MLLVQSEQYGCPDKGDTTEEVRWSGVYQRDKGEYIYLNIYHISFILAHILYQGKS
jgi:hypothetical protein